MAETLLAVMLVAAALYTVLAGADFGAGIIEGLMGTESARARRRRARAGLGSQPRLAGADRGDRVRGLSASVHAGLGAPAHPDPAARCSASSRAAAPSRFATTIRPRRSIAGTRWCFASPAARAAVPRPRARGQRRRHAARRTATRAAATSTRSIVAPWNTAFGWATALVRVRVVRVRRRGAAGRRARAPRRAAAVSALGAHAPSGSRSPAARWCCAWRICKSWPGCASCCTRRWRLLRSAPQRC